MGIIEIPIISYCGTCKRKTFCIVVLCMYLQLICVHLLCSVMYRICIVFAAENDLLLEAHTLDSGNVSCIFLSHIFVLYLYRIGTAFMLCLCCICVVFVLYLYQMELPLQAIYANGFPSHALTFNSLCTYIYLYLNIYMHLCCNIHVFIFISHMYLCS